MTKYPEYKGLNLRHINEEILDFWKENKTFEKSVSTREGKQPWVFYEGPPSANGMPGIHHVMARTLKDIFCRYKTLQGFQVKRKAGWDTHGLPVELGVEKELGITKEDIGKKISIEDYNKACREAVMRYTDVWNNLTEQMGYWVDMDDPYVTYKTKYIESVWWLLKQLFDKKLIYKGYTIQPYSPKAGTGLSSHELNMPGTYRDVTDTTIVAQFKVANSDFKVESLKNAFTDGNLFIMAWTTTPWTLPSNTALTVGKKIEYALVKTYNQYTFEPIQVVLAKGLIGKQFGAKFFEGNNEEFSAFAEGDKKIPYQLVDTFSGNDMLGINYEQLLPWAAPHQDAEKAFVVIPGDFVTTEDGTGIVHTAPTFGVDDAQVAKEAGVPPLLILDENENAVPLVDLQGKFVKSIDSELAGKYVKNEYYKDEEVPNQSADVQIAIQLKTENRAFNVAKYVHSYPHCWRTDKPILYYPLDSWFIKSTAQKDRMIELNKTINWKPASTGTGRFGNWLENLNDWNLSRSRYWGIPLPLWSTEDGDEVKCFGSVEELKAAADKSVAAGFMESNPLANFEVGNMDEANYDAVDLHKNFTDKLVLVSDSGKPMHRESDLIDVWFDSGSMPYAQWHYPFENKEMIDNHESYPADYIAEGVDQTRGWFFTLHAIGTMVFDSVAYKNVISNGLVLDKNGQKMSKRLGNAADPFETMEKYGADATRWYMITNAQPWDNLKFDLDGIQEVQRKFFGTLYNTYSFFALYANLDGFKYEEADIALSERPEIDRWILSELNTLIAQVEDGMEAFEPTRAFRPVQEFVTDKLSNWYVRLCRRRFWKGEYATDKISAYQTLYTCLETVSRLASPLAPFFTEKLFRDLHAVTGKDSSESVHLSTFPKSDKSAIDSSLEDRMHMAQQVSSMVLSLRKKESLKVRQPLARILVPVMKEEVKHQLELVKDLILSEVNVKELEMVLVNTGETSVFEKLAKPNFRLLGPKFGKNLKVATGLISKLTQDQIAELESGSEIQDDNNIIAISIDDVEISTKDIPGMLVSSENGMTVALDITLNEALKQEGIARELINRIQNTRKDSGFEVTDKIDISLFSDTLLKPAVEENLEYIKTETLANNISFVENVSGDWIEFDGVKTKMSVEKV